jgi:hypothetical protein
MIDYGYGFEIAVFAFAGTLLTVVIVLAAKALERDELAHQSERN